VTENAPPPLPGPPFITNVIDGWRDVWHHRMELRGHTRADNAASIDRELLGDAIPELLHGVGSVSVPTEPEVARVAVAALLGAHMATQAAHAAGELSHRVYELIDEHIARGAIPWLHVLGYEPACNGDGGIPPVTTPDVRCPGCGQRIYGEVAARGACLGCFPEVPVAPATTIEPPAPPS
jgi:hypothetical protein